MIGALAGAWPLGADADWMSSAPPLAMPVRPKANSIVQQANPDFSWPMQGASSSYELEVWDDEHDQRIIARVLPNNWITFREPLVASTYRWRVRALKATTGAWSDWRYFSVTPVSATFVLPDWSAAYKAVAERKRPRGLWQDAALNDMRVLVTQQRAVEWARLKGRVQRRYAEPPMTEPPLVTAKGDLSQYYKWTLELPKMLAPQLQQIEEASLMWVLQGDEAARNDAKRRVLSLARFDPAGGTAYEPSHHGARNLLWALVVGYDRLYSQFTQTERNLITAAIDARFRQMEASLVGPGRRLETWPYDSHGWVGLQALGAISCIMASGAAPEWQARFNRYVPWALNSISPWGGEQGGFGNGSAYASWNLDSNIYYWDAIRNSTGIDIYHKPWIANHVNLFAYFTPPGSPTHVFGDGAEKKPASYATWALAARVPGRVSQHVLSSIAKPDDGSNPMALLAPARVDAPPTTLPNSIHLPDLGWVAMHSSLADPQRTSIYFRSGPYGSYNHSHADQNSFVLNAHGERLLIDSGHYDWYQSPHRTQWYRTTRAHNAVTFDGGKGQVSNGFIGDIAASGEIRFFRDYGSHLVVTGSAVPAYGGAVTRALRTLVYVRPRTLFVVDQLASATPRRWEWNMHSTQRFVSRLDGSFAVNGEGACVLPLFGPQASFSQTSAWTAAPEGGAFAPQWHGAFISATAQSANRRVTAIRVGCGGFKDVSASSTQDGGFTLSADGISVQLTPEGLVTTPANSWSNRRR